MWNDCYRVLRAAKAETSVHEGQASLIGFGMEQAEDGEQVQFLACEGRARIQLNQFAIVRLRMARRMSSIRCQMNAGERKIWLKA